MKQMMIGYDLNGWRDVAAWQWFDADDKESSRDDRPQFVSCGIGGVVVRDQASQRLIGCMQAMRAPVGAVGSMVNSGRSLNGSRRRVSSLLSNPTGNTEEIAAALQGMVNPSQHAPNQWVAAVLAVPDIFVGEREQYQDAMLGALSQMRVGTPRLVWRSVLACLATMSGADADGDWVGVIGHDSSGFTSQLLKIRRENGLLAPERKEAGRHHPEMGGLGQLEREAMSDVAACAGNALGDALTSARCVASLALGESPPPEVVRLPGDTWRELHPPGFLPPPSFLDLPKNLVNHLNERRCSSILVDSPVVGRLQHHLEQRVIDHFGREVRVRMVGSQDMAQGALVAAQRFVARQPVYFDFLPQISTIIYDQKSRRPLIYDLVQTKDPLPADKLYVTEHPARFSILDKNKPVHVYLGKEGISDCRLQTIRLSHSAKDSTQFRLFLEQRPAAGRAHLILRPNAYLQPPVINWDDAEEQKGKYLNDILDDMQPGIPNRENLECGLEKWRDGGLARVLKQEVRLTASPSYSWGKLAKHMAQPYRSPTRKTTFRAISSDGELPENLDEEARNALLAVSRNAVNHVMMHIRGEIKGDNQSLRFLTWQFRNCPREIVPHLLDAFMSTFDEKPTATKKHVFVANEKQLAFQSIGRVVYERKEIERVLGVLKRVDINWDRDHLALAGRLLARTDAPTYMKRPEVKVFGKAVINAFKRAKLEGKYNSAFMYAPYVLIGLLRRRERHRYSLVAERNCPLADELLKHAELVIDDMRHKKFSHVPKVRRYRELLEDCCLWIKGRGKNQNILIDISATLGM